MSKKRILISVEVHEDFYDCDVKVGELFLHNGEVYKFDGYDWGTYPMATNIDTEEQIQLSHI